MSAQITSLAFEKRYSDDSGVQFGVRYNADRISYEIEFESVSTVAFPVDQLDWLIACLQRIKEVTP